MILPVRSAARTVGNQGGGDKICTYDTLQSGAVSGFRTG